MREQARSVTFLESREQAVRRSIAEARCPQCNKLLGYNVVAARFRCPRCKNEVTFDAR